MLEDSQFPLCLQLWLYLPFFLSHSRFIFLFFIIFLRYLTYPPEPWLTNKPQGLQKHSSWEVWLWLLSDRMAPPILS